MKYRLGTRKSQLAQVQSNWVLKELEKNGIDCELVFLESPGDKNLKTPLYEIDPETPGLFTKHLEQALLHREIDLAVHSLKDLPIDQPPGLRIACVPKRAATADVLMIHNDVFESSQTFFLPLGATVGTSSLRREALLLSHRPDLKVVPIRGNVPTRVQLAQDRKVDAVLLAAAGLDRLQLNFNGVRRFELPEETFISAPGQGALAVETRDDAPLDLIEGLKRFHDSQTELEATTERAVLKGLFGGCTLPLGVRCKIVDKTLKLNAFLGVLKDKGTSLHQWKGFHRFDLSDTEQQTLISKTVQHFQGLVHE